MTKDRSRFSKHFSFKLHTGEEIFPVQIEARATGKIAFRVSPGGKGGNTLDVTEQVDESTMVKRVLVEGWGVRCSSLDGAVQGQYKPGQRAVAHIKRHTSPPF